MQLQLLTSLVIIIYCVDQSVAMYSACFGFCVPLTQGECKEGYFKDSCGCFQCYKVLGEVCDNVDRQCSGRNVQCAHSMNGLGTGRCVVAAYQDAEEMDAISRLRGGDEMDEIAKLVKQIKSTEEEKRSLRPKGGDQTEKRRSWRPKGGDQFAKRRLWRPKGGDQTEDRRSLRPKGGDQFEKRRLSRPKGGDQTEKRTSWRPKGGDQTEDRRSLRPKGGDQMKDTRSLRPKGGDQINIRRSEATEENKLLKHPWWKKFDESNS